MRQLRLMKKSWRGLPDKKTNRSLESITLKQTKLHSTTERTVVTAYLQRYTWCT